MGKFLLFTLDGFTPYIQTNNKLVPVKFTFNQLVDDVEPVTVPILSLRVLSLIVKVPVASYFFVVVLYVNTISD